jgi:hypothetical protein
MPGESERTGPLSRRACERMADVRARTPVDRSITEHTESCGGSSGLGTPNALPGRRTRSRAAGERDGRFEAVVGAAAPRCGSPDGTASRCSCLARASARAPSPGGRVNEWPTCARGRRWIGRSRSTRRAAAVRAAWALRTPCLGGGHGVGLPANETAGSRRWLGLPLRAAGARTEQRHGAHAWRERAHGPPLPEGV